MFARKIMWKPFIEDNDYQINEFGEFMSYKHRRPKLIKQRLNRFGYPVIGISTNNKYRVFSIHRQVAIHFIPNPQNLPEVNHKNGIKTDCHFSNLEWSTRSLNVQHAYNTGLMISSVQGTNQWQAKLTDNLIKEIRSYKGLKSGKEVAKQFNIHYSSVYQIWQGKTWKHVI